MLNFFFFTTNVDLSILNYTKNEKTELQSSSNLNINKSPPPRGLPWTFRMSEALLDLP